MKKRMTKKHFKKAARGHLRYLLKQLEKAKLVKKGYSGRRITKAGQRVVDSVAKNIVPEVSPILLAVKEAEEMDGQEIDDVENVEEEGK
ncbi:40S ribosomal protein S19, partial [Bonamia ostreae]